MAYAQVAMINAQLAEARRDDDKLTERIDVILRMTEMRDRREIAIKAAATKAKA